MKMSHPRSRLFSWSLFCLVACGGSDSDGNSGADATGAGADAGSSGSSTPSFKVFPPKIYTGFDDGAHKYQAPAITVGAAATVSWKISDPSIATLEPDGKNVMITARKVGSATLTATSGGKDQTASITVYAYTAEQYAAGQKRYQNAADADNPACTSCHGVQQGVDRPNHTPTEVDADTDAELANTFVTGKDPENRPIAEESEFAGLLNGKTHMWKVTATEKVGLLAYLRALEPDGYPEYDAPTESK